MSSSYQKVAVHSSCHAEAVLFVCQWRCKFMCYVAFVFSGFFVHQSSQVKMSVVN